MSIIDDCVQFLEDVILGDFNDQQMVSAQVIGGLNSLIPVVDQMMDVRDISGCIYRINKRGGFVKARQKSKTGNPGNLHECQARKRKERTMVSGDIKHSRRQPYISQPAYENTRRAYDEDYVLLEEKLEYYVGNPQERSALLRLYAAHKWSTFTLNYTVGGDCGELAPYLSEVVEQFERYAVERNQVPDDEYLEPLILDDMIDIYVEYLNLLSAAVLLHREDLIPRIYSLIEDTDYDRADAVIEDLLKFFLPNREQVDEWFWEKPYELLVNAIDASSGSERAKEMRKYVKSWYNEMKGQAHFWGKHVEVEDSYSPYQGYWAMCAAAFTYLYDIDDSTYRDELVYPKDMVDYARSKPRNPVSSNGEELILRVLGGQACVRDGVWFSPAKSDSARRFVAGDLMPEFSNSEYGTTIWQWIPE